MTVYMLGVLRTTKRDRPSTPHLRRCEFILVVRAHNLQNWRNHDSYARDRTRSVGLWNRMQFCSDDKSKNSECASRFRWLLPARRVQLHQNRDPGWWSFCSNRDQTLRLSCDCSRKMQLNFHIILPVIFSYEPIKLTTEVQFIRTCALDGWHYIG